MSNVVAYPLGGPYGSPRVTISSGIKQPQGLLFDSAGDLWVANAGSLAEYARGELTKHSPTPETVIHGGSSFAGMAWDSSGDLWVDDWSRTNSLVADTVDEYGRSQLTKSGAPTPKVVLSGGDLEMPFGLAFDRAGDLWVGNEADSLMLEYTKNQLTRSGSPTPKASFAYGRTEVAFDSEANLWTSTGDNGSVVEYAKAELTNPGALPAIFINSLTTLGQDFPEGLAFDPSGNLWVTTWSGETVVEFSKAQLRKTGSPPPRLIIQDRGGPAAVAIGR